MWAGSLGAEIGGEAQESWGIVTGEDLEGAGLMMCCRIRILGELELWIVGQVGGGSGLDERVRMSV